MNSVATDNAALLHAMADALRHWMKKVGESKSAAATTVTELQNLRNRMEDAGKALANRDASIETADLQGSIVLYRQTLEQLSGFLREFDISLRIRRAELAAARGHANAASQWATAVKHIE